LNNGTCRADFTLHRVCTGIGALRSIAKEVARRSLAGPQEGLQDNPLGRRSMHTPHGLQFSDADHYVMDLAN